MWEQDYLPLANNLPLSALAAATPIFVLLILIGVLRKPALLSGLCALATAAVVALFVYGMPLNLVLGSTTMGFSFGLFPIGWIVFWAVALYRITVETGNFDIIKDSIGGLTSDRRLQAMLIAFALSAFIEGAAGFGTPVAVAAAMLAGLGFSPFFAAGICLLANTAPVAFGSIGIPIITLAGTTGLPTGELSVWTGLLLAPVAVFIPAYLVMVMGGWQALRGVLPAAAVCGLVYAIIYLAASYLGPELVNILAASGTIISLMILFRFWQPRDQFIPSTDIAAAANAVADIPSHGWKRTLLAWSPYIFLVFFVLLWGSGVLGDQLESLTVAIEWPGLHNIIVRGAPVVAAPEPYPAIFNLNLLSAGGTACAFATVAAAIVFRMSIGDYFRLLANVGRQLAFSLLTIASVLGLAYLMNYSGATITLGLAFVATGAFFPFFSALLGWLGVFLTGSDSSANALFGGLQVVTADTLGFDPALLASANAAGGVMGKMISLQSLAVAVAATGMARSQESKLFRFTFKHSLFLAAVMGLLTVLYAYLIR